MNIPLSKNSYRPKPWAYISFTSDAAKESAMELSCSFPNRGLTWHQPDDITSLCYVCGRLGCDPQSCSSFTVRTSSRPDNKLQELYSHYHPAQHRNDTRNNRFNRN